MGVVSAEVEARLGRLVESEQFAAILWLPCLHPQQGRRPLCSRPCRELMQTWARLASRNGRRTTRRLRPGPFSTHSGRSFRTTAPPRAGGLGRTPRPLAVCSARRLRTWTRRTRPKASRIFPIGPGRSRLSVTPTRRRSTPSSRKGRTTLFHFTCGSSRGCTPRAML